ncbi:MAG TPA: translation initiation factor IF-2 N-terminal domain-containing protein, partial [Pyrinomonadaceae bacterium]|nr:translation initiation factor IF-2 N-terminal domain-containing protein [Pyrinomonadaceae bacterium]
MNVTSKIRIYDLAKELKQESKRILEDARREGVDVSVPSNTISKELAEKIRNKYFPKKDPVAPRAIRVKKAVRPADGDAAHEAHDAEIHETQDPAPPPPAFAAPQHAEAETPAP